MNPYKLNPGFNAHHSNLATKKLRYNMAALESTGLGMSSRFQSYRIQDYIPHTHTSGFTVKAPQN